MLLVEDILKLSPVVIGLTVIGAIVTSSFIFNFLEEAYARLLRPGKNLKKYGKWAVITGATDGIGKALAFELAKQGLNIFLISRSQDKLLETSKELIDKYSKIEVKYLAVDFNDFSESIRKTVSENLDVLDIGVLVNNVGISYPYTQYFDELSDLNVEQLIRLNVDSTTWMTRIVLPGMKSRRRGTIVNISSAAGVSTSPLLSQYGAAKSYIAMFTRALHYELKEFGIHVQCQVPLFVTTKLAKLRKTSLLIASPAAYARAAVAAIGFEIVVSPYWSHALQLWALTTFPEFIIARGVLQSHKGIRKAGLKKVGKLDASKTKNN